MGTNFTDIASNASLVAATFNNPLDQIDAAIENLKSGVTSFSKIYINETANAYMTTGLTINQGTADNEILALKSSDVAHGMTDFLGTNTYASLVKQSATDGGVKLQAATETTVALHLAVYATTDNTTKSAAGRAHIELNPGTKSGAGAIAVGADGNLVAIRNYGATRFLFDAEGDSHQDVGTAWTNFDDYDDTRLLTTLSVEVSRPGDPIREQFGEFLQYNRCALEDARLVTFNEDGHHFVNMSRLTMLLVGAVRQLAIRIERCELMLLPEGSG